MSARAAARWCEQLAVYRRRKSCTAIRGGDTLRGNKRALDISRHHCISRNLLLFATRQDDEQNGFQSTTESPIEKKTGSWERLKYSSDVQMFSQQCQACFAVHFTCKCRGGEGEERMGRGRVEWSGAERRREERVGSRRRRRSWRLSTQCRPALLKHAARSSPYTTKTRTLVCPRWCNRTAKKDRSSEHTPCNILDNV